MPELPPAEEEIGDDAVDLAGASNRGIEHALLWWSKLVTAGLETFGVSGHDRALVS